jgi:hypothetical protein
VSVLNGPQGAIELGWSYGRSGSSCLDTPEARVAHQDKTIDKLNDAITAQWRKIDALEQQVAKRHVENRCPTGFIGTSTSPLLKHVFLGYWLLLRNAKGFAYAVILT